MTDTIVWVSLGAVVVSAVVAIFAVYLGYRLQLRSARLARRREAFSDVLSDLEGVFEVAVVLNIMKKEADKLDDLSKSGAAATREEADEIVAGCDACRMQLAIPAPGGQTLRPMGGPNPPTFEEFGLYVYSVRDTISQLFHARSDRLRRGIAATFILGADDSDVKALNALRRRLDSTVSGPPDDRLLKQVEADLNEVRFRLRHAVEE